MVGNAHPTKTFPRFARRDATSMCQGAGELAEALLKGLSQQRGPVGRAGGDPEIVAVASELVAAFADEAPVLRQEPVPQRRAVDLVRDADVHEVRSRRVDAQAVDAL